MASVAGIAKGVNEVSGIIRIWKMISNLMEADLSAYECIENGGTGAACDEAEGRYRTPSGDYEENEHQEESSNAPEETSSKLSFLSDKLIDIVELSSKILAKDAGHMTQGEVKEAMLFTRNNPFHKDSKKIDKKVSEYYDLRYPGKVRYDATGKIIDAKPNVFEPQSPFEHRDKNGVSIKQGFNKILSSMGNNDQDGNSILNLQKSLNSKLDGSSISDNELEWENLKEDNIMGPKTATAAFNAMVKHGADEVDSNFKKFVSGSNDDLFAFGDSLFV